MTLDEHFTAALNNSDTSYQVVMRLLHGYAKQCRHITEFGTCEARSTWALVCANPEKVVSYDIGSRPTHIYPGVVGAIEATLDQITAAVQGTGTTFQFNIGNTALVDIEPTDLLYIDSDHTYIHLTAELARHHDKVGKFMVFHDTTTFADHDEGGRTPGLWQAIEEFLAAHQEWKLLQRIMESNGVTVLSRV